MASISTRYSYSDTFDGLSEQSDGSAHGDAGCSSPHSSKSLQTDSRESLSNDKTHVYSGSSSMSDTLTYCSEEGSQQEGFTDIEDEYSDTFESGFPTETVRSTTQQISRSYLETVDSSGNTGDNYASQSYVESVASLKTSLKDGFDSRSYLESIGTSGTSMREEYGSKSYLESVASSVSTSGQEEIYLQDSFESPSQTATSVGLHTYDMTESHIFGPATEEIRELSYEDLIKAEAFEAQESFLNHWLVKLRNKSRLDHAASEPESEVKHDSKEQRTFCHRKINQLRQQKKFMKGIALHRKEKEVVKTEPVEAYGLSSAVVDKLRLENVIKKMEHLSSEEVHEVQKCKLCRKQQKRLEEADARKQFLQYHSCRLQSKEVDLCVEKHLTKMTSINMIAEILRDLPRVSECSEELLYQYKQHVLKRMKDSTHNKSNEALQQNNLHDNSYKPLQ